MLPGFSQLSRELGMSDVGSRRENYVYLSVARLSQMVELRTFNSKALGSDPASGRIFFYKFTTCSGESELRQSFFNRSPSLDSSSKFSTV